MKKRITLIGLCLFISGMAHAQIGLSWQSKFSSPTSNWAFALNPLDNRIVYSQQGGVFYVSHDRGDTWQARGNCPQQEVRNISVSPIDTNCILLCAFGLWKSNDGGWTWREVLPGVVLDGETIDYNFQNPATIYFADFFSSAFYVSHDTGSTWTQRSTIGFGFVCTLASNPLDSNIIVAGAGDTKIAQTTDAGHTWRLAKTGNPYFSEVPKLVWDKLDPSVAYAAIQLDEEYSIYKSTDHGTTWFDVGMYDVFMWGMDMNPETGDLYVGAFLDDAGRTGVYRSCDQARSWQRLGSTPLEVVWMIKAARDGYVYALEGSDAIYRIGTGGLGKLHGTITDSASGLPLSNASIIVQETGDSVIVNNSDGHYAFRLLPGTYTLRFQISGISRTVAGVVFAADSSDSLNVSLPAGLFYGSIGGVVQNAGLQGIESIVRLHGHHSNGLPFLLADTTDASGEFGFANLSSLDVYDSLTVFPQVLPYARVVARSIALGNYAIQAVPADVLIVNDADESYTTVYENALAQSGITFATWDVAQRGLSVPTALAGQTAKQVVVWYTNDLNPVLTPAEHDTLVAICEKGYDLFLTGMNLAEWNAGSDLFQNHLGVGFNSNYSGSTTVRGFNGNIISDGISMAIAPSLQPSKDILNLLTAHVFKAFRYGTSAADSVKIAGVYIDNTGSGGKAVFMGIDLHQAPSSAIRTILQRSVAYFDQLVDVDPGDNLLPTDARLKQNYPNPFNPSTSIEFTVNRRMPVTLSVYNILGQHVMTLVDQRETAAGNHRVVWNGRNEAGQQVSSGVYLVRLQAGTQLFTKRILLLK